MKRAQSYTPGALLAMALLLVPAARAHAALMHGIGAMGSSTTDEYQFSPLHPTARNWVEILAATRDWNFGSSTTASRDDPHTAEQLLPLVHDELRRLAAERMAQEKPGQTLQAARLAEA